MSGVRVDWSFYGMLQLVGGLQCKDAGFESIGL